MISLITRYERHHYWSDSADSEPVAVVCLFNCPCQDTAIPSVGQDGTDPQETHQLRSSSSIRLAYWVDIHFYLIARVQC